MNEKGDNKTSPETSSGRSKQPLILLAILALTLVTATNKGLYKEIYPSAYYYQYFYTDLFLFALPGIGGILMLILTHWKGRRVLFMTLYILSLLTSLIDLIQVEFFGLRYKALCLLVHAPVEGSAIALLYIVICEYCAPERRFLFLIANSAIQTLFYWITLVTQSENGLTFFVDYLQYFNIILGVFGLWSVFRWPESPYWLASKRRFEECAKAFVEVRGRGSETSEELHVLTDGSPRPGSAKMIYAPLLIALPALSMSAKNFETINFYKRSLPFLRLDKYFLTLKCIAAVACVLTVLIPVELPRKVLFLSCGFFYASEFFVLLANLKMEIPLLAIIFDVIVDYGPRTVTLPLLFEIVPQKYVNLITVFIIVIYLVIEPLFVGVEMVLAGSPIVMLLVIISYFIMPEVKEKTLVEIEQLYVSKKEISPQSIQTDL